MPYADRSSWRKEAFGERLGIVLVTTLHDDITSNGARTLPRQQLPCYLTKKVTIRLNCVST